LYIPWTLLTKSVLLRLRSQCYFDHILIEHERAGEQPVAAWRRWSFGFACRGVRGAGLATKHERVRFEFPARCVGRPGTTMSAAPPGN